MSLSFLEFCSMAAGNYTLLLTTLLTLAVILVNGWTDAPNAIASTVSTGTLPFSAAVLLAALCNFLGVLCVTSLDSSVAETIFSIVVFDSPPHYALAALCAAMTSVILWSCFAWYFGIPTSESHALAAGISGAAIALEGSFSCVQWEAWSKILFGLFLSSLAGFFAGRFGALLFSKLPLSSVLCKQLQIIGAAGTAFFHGAQDGQKFLGVFLLGAALSQGHQHTESFSVPLWMLVLCAAFMAMGTRIGGKRIIDHIGSDMIQIGPKEGLAGDFAGISCLALATLHGIPVSTTHTRTAALLGSGTSSGKPVDWSVARQILLAWLLTFPACTVMGFGTALLYFYCFYDLAPAFCIV